MKKRLLFVINTLGRAGAEMALIEMLKKLDSMNKYELYLYSIIPCGELFDQVPQNVHILNKNYSSCSVLSPLGRIKIIKAIISAFFYRLTGFRLLGYMIKNIREQRADGGKVQLDKLLWRLLAEGKPVNNESYDLALAYIEGAATYYVSDRVNAISKASFIHIDYKLSGYTSLMDKDCYSRMDRIYVVSKAVGERFGSIYPHYKDKIKLFRNLLDREAILLKAKGQATDFTDEFDGIRLLTVGRLHYQKGYDIAIEALARIIKEGYKVRWYIIGEGLERSNLESLIKKYKIENSFILLGMKDNPYPYIKQADIYVQATRFEGKSIAIEEAQILGKAIVASDCTGNTEQIISGFDGILFSLSVDNLVRELKLLIDNPQARKEYEENVKLKKLEHSEDLRDMLTLIEKDGENNI